MYILERQTMNKRKKVAIIIPYFGSFPNYFDYWLESAQANSDFDFLIFTDNLKYKTKGNIHFINMTFLKFKELIQRQIEFKICLNVPYKICDYRPVFGLALKDYLVDYDFWGFGDVDVILGNLSHFITPEVLNNYDKIYELGHLTLLRNNEECNNLWKIKHHLRKTYRYDEAFKTPYPCHFDEAGGLTPIAKLRKIKTYDSIDFGDIDYTKYNFVLNGRQTHTYKGLFKWTEGVLTYIYLKDNQINSEEVCYAHFQKRKLNINFDKMKNKKEFIIIPNEITYSRDANELLRKQKIKEYYPYYEKNKFKSLLNKIKKHALQQRIYRMLFQKFYRSILDKRY